MHDIQPAEYRLFGADALETALAADLSTASGRYSFAHNIDFAATMEAMAQGGDFEQLLARHLNRKRLLSDRLGLVW